MRDWLRGKATGLALAAALEAGIVRRVSIHDSSVAGYHAAMHLHRRGHLHNISLNSVEFSRLRSR